jgi:hypothetical protein
LTFGSLPKPWEDATVHPFCVGLRLETAPMLFAQLLTGHVSRCRGSTAGPSFSWHLCSPGKISIFRCKIGCFWEKYFELLGVKDAHARKNCRELNGTELWACCNCDCTNQLAERLAQKGEAFFGARPQEMAGHESPRTTKLYDRTKDGITLGEAERIPL